MRFHQITQRLSFQKEKVLNQNLNMMLYLFLIKLIIQSISYVLKDQKELNLRYLILMRTFILENLIFAII